MNHKTTVLLDEESHLAARQLAAKFDVSTSQAIRQAIVGYRDLVVGPPADLVARRTAAFSKLVELFDGRDPEVEMRAMESIDGF